MAPNETSYMTSYASSIVTVVILNRFGDISNINTCTRLGEAANASPELHGVETSASDESTLTIIL